MSRTITIPSHALALRSDQPLTPAMTSAIWELAAHIDRNRIVPKGDEAVWVEMPAVDLRGPGSRHDNVWLRQCLDRMMGVKMSGEHRGDPWGAVLLAEWAIKDGGSTVRMLIPPTGMQALATPSQFVKIEADAAHRLTGQGRRLYALLADKKNMNQSWWVFPLDELRTLMGAEGKTSYQRFNNFRQFVLNPAVAQINDYGTVAVKMTPQKRGRTVVGVRFDWNWKDPKAAKDVDTQNERHSKARRKKQRDAGAPPLIETTEQADPALTWWAQLTAAERDRRADQVGRTVVAEGPGGKVITAPRREADIAHAAFKAEQAERSK